jgi:hypothetical protein
MSQSVAQLNVRKSFNEDGCVKITEIKEEKREYNSEKANTEVDEPVVVDVIEDSPSKFRRSPVGMNDCEGNVIDITQLINNQVACEGNELTFI